MESNQPLVEFLKNLELEIDDFYYLEDSKDGVIEQRSIYVYDVMVPLKSLEYYDIGDIIDRYCEE